MKKTQGGFRGGVNVAAGFITNNQDGQGGTSNPAISGNTWTGKGSMTGGV